MKFANVRELKNKTSEILRKAEKETVIITSRGKPKAMVTAISEEDFEDYLIERTPELIDALEEAAKEYARKGGITLENYISGRKKSRVRV
jgi:prevent-host-death family protein